MSFYIILAAVIFTLLDVVVSHADQGLHNMYDRAHLQQHMQGINTNTLKENEMRFNYFHAHDIDGNKKLDGLEVLQAFTHYHAADDPVYSDQELEAAIDLLLVPSIDRNVDGFLDYAEFIEAEKALHNF